MSSESQITYNPLKEARLRLAERGAYNLSTSELLGLVLGTGAIHEALNVAEQLLATHHGLAAIVQNGVSGLCVQAGIGEAKATQIVAALELGKRLSAERLGELPQIRNPSHAASLCLPEMGLFEQEQLRVLFLDTRNRVMGCKDVLVGTAKSININVCDVFRDAIRRNSMGIVVAHNHPSGDPTPSAEDIRITHQLIEAGKMLDIDLIDHLVIGRGCYVSLRERITDDEWHAA